MLRIDDSSKTLVAPQTGGFEPEAPLERSDLLALIYAGWGPFALEMGEVNMHLVAVEPEPGVDLVAFDEASGRAVVLLLAGSEPPAELLGRAVMAAGRVASWDAQRLASVHQALEATVPGESPRVVLVGAAFDDGVLAAVDWLSRRHGLDVAAQQVRILRFGSERLMQVTRAYPGRPSDAPDPAHQFMADVSTASSVPPPVAPPAPAPAA